MNYSTLADINMTQVEIDADAAAILRSATEAVATILARREDLDGQGLHDTPLIVLAGEVHSVPAHKVHHMLILNGLADSGQKIVLGYELPHNRLSRTFFNKMNRRYDPVIESGLQERDRNGILALQCEAGFFGYSHSDHSRNILFRYLQRDGRLAVRFTDRAKRSTSSLGERNHNMGRMMMDFAGAHNASIAVQQCGNNHIAGNNKSGRSACDSLSAYFKARGLPILAMPIFRKGESEEQLPVDHGLQENEKLFRTGVPGREAAYHPSTDKATSSKPVDFDNRAAEALYMNETLRSLGLENECVSAEEHWTNKKTLIDEVMEQLKALDKELFPTLWSRAKNRMNFTLPSPSV